LRKRNTEEDWSKKTPPPFGRHGGRVDRRRSPPSMERGAANGNPACEPGEKKNVKERGNIGDIWKRRVKKTEHKDAWLRLEGRGRRSSRMKVSGNRAQETYDAQQ